MEKDFIYIPDHWAESGQEAHACSGVAVRPAWLTWLTSDWAGPRGVSSCGTQSTRSSCSGVAVVRRACDMARLPAGKDCLADEKVLTVSALGSQRTGVARSWA
jgi:hypothetical protein